MPRLRSGPLQGHPRAYALALELVSHTDGSVDMENLSVYVRAYQSGSPLRLGELWAVPIMLRLALIENLRRVAYRVASRRRHRDPADVYARMDFRTRDRYRHVVERLAKRTGRAEPDVAAEAVRLAASRQGRDGANPRETHVGYFLVDRGLAELERAVGCPAGMGRRLGRALARRGPALYLASAALATAGGAAGLLAWHGLGTLAWPGRAAVALALGLVASRSALALVNWLVTVLVPPRSPPRMDFSKGIPPEHRTVVAEQAWMGQERKRGKRMDFTRLLRGGAADAFAAVEADLSLLASCRYVLTLDSDTHLPPGAAWKMAGTLAHPLNRPVVDPATGCVVRGYGLLQPRKVPWTAQAGRVLAGEGRRAAGELLHLAVLPYEALVHLDAIGRVLWRVLASGRLLLEWQTAHDADRSARARVGLAAVVREMWASPAVAAATAGVVAWLRPEALGAALALAGPWLVGPVLAWLVSRPIVPRLARFSADQQALLRRLARRT